MILVDTSVWISHLRNGNSDLIKLLNNGSVVCHPFIIGEIACGSIRNRKEILMLLNSLSMSEKAEHEEVLEFINKKELMGKGLGYIDIHLLASSILSNALYGHLIKHCIKKL